MYMIFVSRLFGGRINRRNYLVGTTLSTLLLFFIVIFLGILSPRSTRSGWLALAEDAVAWILILVMSVYTWSFQVRRAHNIGKSGWNLSKGISDVWEFRFLFKKGENKENKYGKPPESKIDIQSLLGFS